MKEYGIINAYCLDLDGSPAKLTSARNSKCHGLERVEWRPGAWRLFPLPLKAHVKSVVPFIHLRYLVYWWLCYHLQRWRKKGYYRISLALDQGYIVHYGVTRSRDFRFPFMADSDLQMGPVWTDPRYRSSGISTETLQAVSATVSRDWRRLWWLCRDDNAPSNRIPVTAGFSRRGLAMRRPSVFAGLFGIYTLYGQMNYGTVTERPGQRATADQNSMRRARYELAAKYAGKKEVLEIACGSGMGLGFLARTAKRVVGGDIDEDNCRIASAAYRGDPRVDVIQCDGHSIPFSARSFDVVLLFEAIYYLGNVGALISEVRRVLRSGGTLVISSVNCDWQGFNPSPFSTRYYTAAELRQVLVEQGFHVEVLVGFPDGNSSYFGQFVRIARTVAIALDVIPKTMSGKEWLKRLFYGELKEMTPEDIEEPCRPCPLWPLEQVTDPAAHRMLYVIARVAEHDDATRHDSEGDRVLTFARETRI